MKTYPLPILREAFLSLVDRNKYVKFTIYLKKPITGKPLKCKAKIFNLFADKKGLKVSFTHFWINGRSKYCLAQTGAIPLRDIRWQTNPFDEKALEDLCIKLVKKLEAPYEVS